MAERPAAGSKGLDMYGSHAYPALFDVRTDNSAGNFVKIQQRIPVRIDFTNLSSEDNERLAAGMMVVVKARQ